ncbi:hypothetical protein N7541_005685 [Penicillium brevicompactum]|uniref:Malate dehydrogenase n=1 Tax=Penicillium brevicompactum TaxID=5074 RepID=A0A9W9UTY9_PENBR|nr:hypothetical protein N7541_005685 [Penicillium brevicompactum]
MVFLIWAFAILTVGAVNADLGQPPPLALASSFTNIYHQLDSIHLGNCSLANATLPLSATKTPLPAPSTNLTLKYVALGRGTQNYTCPSNSSSDPESKIKPEATGAVATLFDASCLAAASESLLHEVPVLISTTPLGSLAFMAALVAQGTRSTNLIIGEHYFNGQGDPVFDLSLSGPDSWIATTKKAAVPAPNLTLGTSIDVPWLKLGYKKGHNLEEVYRVVTSLGDPPSTCAGQNATILVPYAAEYWFYG